jgi:enoyl-CoA hydratase
LILGGDIKAIRQFVIDQPFENEMAPPSGHKVLKLFQAEYSLTVDLATLPFPSVALCHGVWMGFGVGLAGFLDSRVVTEKTTFAMPECSIGVHLLNFCEEEEFYIHDSLSCM